MSYGAQKQSTSFSEVNVMWTFAGERLGGDKQTNLPTMGSHPSLSEPVGKDWNSGKEMGEHKKTAILHTWRLYCVHIYIYICTHTHTHVHIMYLHIIMYLHRASWHSSAAMTEVFRAFSSVVRQMPGYNSPRWGTARTLPKILCCSMYCLCVNVYCTTATGWQPNCS